MSCCDHPDRFHLEGFLLSEQLCAQQYMPER